MTDETHPVGDEPAAPAAMVAARREGETLPSYGVEDVDLDYRAMLKAFQDRALFVDGVRKEALCRTNAVNWLARKQKDGNTTYSLMGPGAERIRTVAPIGFINKRRRVDEWRKDDGPGYTIYYEADVYLGNAKGGLLPVIGSCSSDDDFFSTEYKRLDYNADNPEHTLALESGEGSLTNDKKTLLIRRRIPAGEVTKENIEKSALTNLIVNGVTRVLGIRAITAEELTAVGVAVDKIGGFEYGSGRAQSGRAAPADEQKRQEIRSMMIELSGGDEAKALEKLKERTKFNDYPGCQGWDRLSQKQIAMHHERVKKDYDKFRGEGGGTPPAAKQGGGARGQQRGGGGELEGGQRPLI